MKLIAILASLLVIAICATASGQTYSDLYCPDPDWDFGEVGIDFDIYHVFTLINASAKPIHLDSVQAPCDCSWVRISDSIVNPGDTCLVTLKFSTKDFYGRTTKIVEVHWLDPRPRMIQMTYSATVGQFFGAVQPKPVSLFFLPAHTSLKLAILNPKLPRVRLSGIEMYSDFVGVKTTSAEAAAGKNLELEVTARPDLKAGTYEANMRLEVSVDGENRPIFMTIPIKIVRY